MYRIYYADGSTYEGEDGPPTGDRARHVQAILQDDRYVGVHGLTQSSAYGWRDGEWIGLDWFDVWDFLLDSGIIVFGSTVRREEYKAIMDRVNADKHGWLADELKV
jgi:hypothetical protein